MVLAHRALLFFFLTTIETEKKLVVVRTPFQRLKATSCPSVGQWRGCGPPSQPEALGGLLDAIWSARSSVTMKNKTKSVRRKKTWCLRDPQTCGGRSHHRIPVIPRGRDVSTTPDVPSQPVRVLRPFSANEPRRLEKKKLPHSNRKKSMSVEFSYMVITYKRHSRIVVLSLIGTPAVSEARDQ